MPPGNHATAHTQPGWDSTCSSTVDGRSNVRAQHCGLATSEGQRIIHTLQPHTKFVGKAHWDRPRHAQGTPTPTIQTHTQGTPTPTIQTHTHPHVRDHPAMPRPPATLPPPCPHSLSTLYTGCGVKYVRKKSTHWCARAAAKKAASGRGP
eukprot:364013-Chlamydomonas_euryale.AAC.15